MEEIDTPLYVTLSYRWGSVESLKLTSDSLEKLRTG